MLTSTDQVREHSRKSPKPVGGVKWCALSQVAAPSPLPKITLKTHRQPSNQKIGKDLDAEEGHHPVVDDTADAESSAHLVEMGARLV